MKADINLPIKGKWFDMIARGEKKEEYRDCEHRQVQRAYLAASNNRWWFHTRKRIAIFRNGYTMKSRALAVKITGFDLRGKHDVKHTEWGEPTCRRSHLVIMLGEIIAKGPYADLKRILAQGQDKPTESEAEKCTGR